MLLFCLLALTPEVTLKDPHAHFLKLMFQARYAMVLADYTRALELADAALEVGIHGEDAAFLKVEILEERLVYRAVSFTEGQRDLIRALTAFMERFPGDYRFPKKLGSILVDKQSLVRLHDLKPPDHYLDRAVSLMSESLADFSAEMADTYFAMGRWYMKKFEYFHASRAFTKVCAIDEDFPMALYYAGYASEASHQLRQALGFQKRFRKTGGVQPRGRRAFVDLNIAVLQMQLEPNDVHFEELLSVLEGQEYDFEVLHGVTEELAKTNRHETILRILSAVPEGLKDYRYKILELEMERRLGRYDVYLEGVKKLVDGIEDRKTLGSLIGFAAESAFLKGAYKDVFYFYQTYGAMTKLAPNLEVYAALATYRLEEDSSSWERVVRQNTGSSLVRLLADEADRYGIDFAHHRLVVELLKAKSQWDRVLDYLVPLNQGAAPHPSFAEDAAVAFALTGRPDSCFAIYEQLLKEYPDRPDLKNNYGYFLTEAGRDLEKARRLIREALEKDPENDAFLDSLGWVHFKLGLIEDAERYLRLALSERERDSEKNEHLGDVLWALGRHEEAKRYWSIAMEDAGERYLELLEKLDPPR